MKPDHFWEVFYSWSLGLGFVLVVLLIVMLWTQWYNNDVHNPFGPFIRAFERRQQLNHKIKMMKVRAQLVHDGLDPDYVKFLDRELEADRESNDQR